MPRPIISTTGLRKNYRRSLKLLNHKQGIYTRKSLVFVPKTGCFSQKHDKGKGNISIPTGRFYDTPCKN
jgi:TnpA family transposase